MQYINWRLVDEMLVRCCYDVTIEKKYLNLKLFQRAACGSGAASSRPLF